jgi:signal transduction histidine kinase
LPPVSSPLAKGKIYYWLNNDSINLQPLTDSFSVKFTKLRPGSYQLFAKYINADGYESKTTLLQKFSVKNPFWQQLWFIILCVAAAVVLITSLILFEQKRRFNKKLAVVEMQQKIQKEKERISRDLHDNVGGQLSYVLFSLDGIAEEEKEKRREITSNVNDSIRNVISNLRETIWAINDEHISINDFSDKFKVYAKNMFRHTNTQIEFAELIEQNKKLDSLTGLNLFRICQEIINNIFKHAAANKVIVSISSADKISIEISDDGKGFDCKETQGGFGLQNIAVRAKDAGIIINCSSEIGEGTVYTLQL